MRVLIAVLILIFSFQSTVLGEIQIDNLFGVKILDNVEKYSNKNKGVEQPNRPGTFYFPDETINIERNDEFDSYYLRTDSKYRIINITGKKYFNESIDTFKNNCLESKKQMIVDMSLFFEKTGEKFLQNYWHYEKYKSIWDESQIFYNDGNNELLLAIHCSYRQYNGSFFQELGVSWVTKDYYEKHIKGLWKKIKKFDNKFIKSFIVVSENT